MSQGCNLKTSASQWNNHPLLLSRTKGATIACFQKATKTQSIPAVFLKRSKRHRHGLTLHCDAREFLFLRITNFTIPGGNELAGNLCSFMTVQILTKANLML